MGEQRGLAPLLTVDLAPVTVELNLRESGARFPCKWSSVLEIYTDGKKHARNVYARTREECEEKLKVLIIEMKTELAELKRQKAEGTLPPQAPEGKKGPKKTKENK